MAKIRLTVGRYTRASYPRIPTGLPINLARQLVRHLVDDFRVELDERVQRSQTDSEAIAHDGFSSIEFEIFVILADEQTAFEW